MSILPAVSSREDPTSGGPTEILQTSLSSTYRLRIALIALPCLSNQLRLCSCCSAVFESLVSWHCSVALPILNRSAALLLALLRRFAKPQSFCCFAVGFAPSLRQIQLFQLYLLFVPSLLPCASYQSTNFLHCSTILPINFRLSTDSS